MSDVEKEAAFSPDDEKSRASTGSRGIDEGLQAKRKAARRTVQATGHYDEYPLTDREKGATIQSDFGDKKTESPGVVALGATARTSMDEQFGYSPSLERERVGSPVVASLDASYGSSNQDDDAFSPSFYRENLQTNRKGFNKKKSPDDGIPLKSPVRKTDEEFGYAPSFERKSAGVTKKDLNDKNESPGVASLDASCGSPDLSDADFSPSFLQRNGKGFNEKQSPDGVARKPVARSTDEELGFVPSFNRESDGPNTVKKLNDTKKSPDSSKGNAGSKDQTAGYSPSLARANDPITKKDDDKKKKALGTFPQPHVSFASDALAVYQSAAGQPRAPLDPEDLTPVGAMRVLGPSHSSDDAFTLGEDHTVTTQENQAAPTSLNNNELYAAEAHLVDDDSNNAELVERIRRLEEERDRDRPEIVPAQLLTWPSGVTENDAEGDSNHEEECAELVAEQRRKRRRRLVWGLLALLIAAALLAAAVIAGSILGTQANRAAPTGPPSEDVRSDKGPPTMASDESEGTGDVPPNSSPTVTLPPDASPSVTLAPNLAPSVTLSPNSVPTTAGADAGSPTGAQPPSVSPPPNSLPTNAWSPTVTQSPNVTPPPNALSPTPATSPTVSQPPSLTPPPNSSPTASSPTVAQSPNVTPPPNSSPTASSPPAPPDNQNAPQTPQPTPFPVPNPTNPPASPTNAGASPTTQQPTPFPVSNPTILPPSPTVPPSTSPTTQQPPSNPPPTTTPTDPPATTPPPTTPSPTTQAPSPFPTRSPTVPPTTAAPVPTTFAPTFVTQVIGRDIWDAANAGNYPWRPEDPCIQHPALLPNGDEAAYTAIAIALTNAFQDERLTQFLHDNDGIVINMNKDIPMIPEECRSMRHFAEFFLEETSLVSESVRSSLRDARIAAGYFG